MVEMKTIVVQVMKEICHWWVKVIFEEMLDDFTFLPEV